MQNLTRRAAIGAIASIPATGVAGAALASGEHQTAETVSRSLGAPSCRQMSESPVDKIERLGREMAVALDEWLDAFSVVRPGGRRPSYHARVWPASSGHTYVLVNDRALRPEPHGQNDARLANLESAWLENDREWNRRLKAVTAAHDAGQDITELEEAANVFARRDIEIVDEIMAIPADTLKGVMVKMRMPNHTGCRIDELLQSVAADIERIAGCVS